MLFVKRLIVVQNRGPLFKTPVPNSTIQEHTPQKNITGRLLQNLIMHPIKRSIYFVVIEQNIL
jgi:hypothetical protein